MMKNAYIHCLNLTSVWWQQRRRRRRPACAHGRVVAVADEPDGVESGGDLESFGMKSETAWGGLLFIGSKISAAALD
jgi:hypothetical protein